MLKKSDLPNCVAQCAFTHAFQCENREQLREWDWIPLKEGFSHSPKRGNNSVPLPTKTSQLVITYKWERSELECIWGWAARSYQRGALAPKHKWMERAQCNGETEQRCTVSRAEREETFAWGKGGWILGKRLLMKNWDPFFPKWHGFVPMQMRFLQRWHSTWKKMGIFQEQNSLTTWMKREKEFYSVRNFVLPSFTWQALAVNERTVKYESGQCTFVFPPVRLCDNDSVVIHLHHCGHRPHKEKEGRGGPWTNSQ